MKRFIIRLIGPTAKKHLQYLIYRLTAFAKLSGSGPRECPICGYTGPFGAFGLPPRLNAQCPHCASLERHRLLYLAFVQCNLLSDSDNILHFAPEPCITGVIKKLSKPSATYRSADLNTGVASMELNIEKIDLPDKSMDFVIACHVLEHVESSKDGLRLMRTLP